MAQNVWIKRTLLVVLMGIVTIVQVNFVGATTIYSLKVANIREELHDSIVHNHPPAGGWVERGANDAMNIRVVIPYLVEFLHDETGARVLHLYKVVDLICIWLALITFFAYLREQFSAWESGLTCLYFAAILPATFALHFYHPYDRASLVAWLLAIWCARARRFWEFSAVAIVAVLIKFDAIVLPGLYFLGNATSQTWRKYLFQSSAIAIILFVIFEGLSLSLGGVWVRPDYGAQILRNFKMMIGTGIFYPPSLAFGLPIVLAILGYKSSDQFMRASVWFAGMIAVILIAASNFEELRAEQMLIPLLAPAALYGLRRILGEPTASQRQPQPAHTLPLAASLPVARAQIRSSPRPPE
jgi:hypothetical protein